MKELNDEELMVMYQNGNEMAFRILYERHSSKIYGYLRKRTKEVEKVPDIFQEVFVKIHRSKHLYNKSLPVLPWLFTVTKSVMIDQIRKNKNKNFAAEVDLENIPALELSLSTGSTMVTDLIQHLPAAQKASVQMRYVDGSTFEEIAKSLNTSPTNARQLISRGVKRLKQLLGEGGIS